jgi:hypothetical protein
MGKELWFLFNGHFLLLIAILTKTFENGSILLRAEKTSQPTTVRDVTPCRLVQVYRLAVLVVTAYQ